MTMLSRGNAAQCRNNNCGPTHIRDGNGSVGWAISNGSGYWISDSHYSLFLSPDDVSYGSRLDAYAMDFGPQKKKKKRLTTGQIAGLSKDLKDMLTNPDCAKFARALLSQLGNSYSDDPITLFTKIGQQGGFYQISFPPVAEASRTIGSGNASIGIVLLKENQGAARSHNALARSLFHELVHGSPNSKNSIGHPEMAQVAYAVAIAQGHKNLVKPPEPGSNYYDDLSSTSFESSVFAACRLR